MVAIEPSSAMLTQRVNSYPAVQGVAEHLPFRDGAFDAALGTFTVHHWSDQAAGLRELRRVSGRQVLVVYEPLVSHHFWLVDYFPEELEATIEANAPTPEYIGRHLKIVDVQTKWIPADCTDGVAAAFWRRPLPSEQVPETPTRERRCAPTDFAAAARAIGLAVLDTQA